MFFQLCFVQLAKHFKPSLTLWQQSTPCDFYAVVVAWDAAAWTMRINFLPEERAAIERSIKQYLEPYAQCRLEGKALPPGLPMSSSVESFFIRKVRGTAS